MSTLAIRAAVAERDAILSAARSQWDAGMRAGIAAAAASEPLLAGAATDDTYWAAGYLAGYDAALEG